MSASQPDFDLDAKYARLDGEILLTGVQALVRVVFDQVRADRRRGLHTAAFVSGYPGSPLGGFDQALARTGPMLDAHDVKWVPGVNEDLAAAAVWGSQQDNLAPLAQHDGVVGLWYGKAPGVDRSGDAFRHGNLHGVGRGGGVLVAAGDDPASKSSTLPNSSQVALYDAGMPVLAAGNPQEVLDLGLHGFALSRYSGLWASLKMVTAVCDGFGAATVATDRIVPVQPELVFEGRPWRHVQRAKLFLPDTLDLEGELFHQRTQAALAYARDNRLDVAEVDPPGAWICIVSYGHTYRQVRQALAELGLADDEDLRAAGVRLVRLGLISPLEPSIVRAAARGVEELLVVEDKRPFVETSVRDLLYGGADCPRVLGKRDELDLPLVPLDGELTAERLRPVLAARLGRRIPTVAAAATARTRTRTMLPLLAAVPTRTAAFCSGCPHNRSTVEVSGSPVGGGIGCHAMTLWLDRGTVSYTYMGGEGANWIGRAPFTEVGHFVQNVGDGTFFHSGSLAVRAAVSAGVTMTFKILYNGVVAMTGGQDPAGQLDIPALSHLLAAEGVARTIVVSDDPRRLRASGSLARGPKAARSWFSRTAGGRGSRLAPGVRVWDRDRLDDAERTLAATPGVTVLVYDQACAAELRRMRKRGKAPDRRKRVIINEAVCEGCGDCGVKSNCLSVHPVETPLGRRTQIHQASCNTDYSCLDGDCPSFVTVRAPKKGTQQKGAGKSRTVRAAPTLPTDIPEPAHRADVGDGGWGLVAAGVGGTGVVTLNQVLATAAFLEGLQASGLDQTGLAQKGGPVVSHLVLSKTEIKSMNAVSPGGADLYLALDLLVGADSRYLPVCSPERTATVVSTSVVPTADMVRGTVPLHRADPALEILRDATRPGALTALDSVGISESLFGDSMAANLVTLGAAYQAGAVPLPASVIERAIELNGVAVARNQAAFRAGRLAFHDPARLPRAGRDGSLARHHTDSDRARAERLAAGRDIGPAGPVGDLVLDRTADLVGYQGSRLAGRYLDLVEQAHRAERECVPGGDGLAKAVAEGYFHLLAYKDEYEVARLHLLPEATAALARAVPGGAGARYWLHPPVLRALGMKHKIGLPTWLARPAFGVLRAGRHLRGTPLDLFGLASVRRTERRLAARYATRTEEFLSQLTPDRHEVTVELARLPLTIRGYEHIKLAAVERYESERAALETRLTEQEKAPA